MSSLSPNTFLKLLRISGFAEGVSFLVLLLIAMPLKYFAGKPEAVHVIGMLHGVLFIIYVLVLSFFVKSQKLSLKKFLLALVLAFLPAGTFFLGKIINQATLK